MLTNFFKDSDNSYKLFRNKYANNFFRKENKFLQKELTRTNYNIFRITSKLTVDIFGKFSYTKWLNKKKRIQTFKSHEIYLLKSQVHLLKNELGIVMAQVKNSNKRKLSIHKKLNEVITLKNYQHLKLIEHEFKELQASSSALELILERIESKYLSYSLEIRLEYPDITTNDLKHCIFIKCGLSVKESAQILNVSISAIKSARRRLKIKMNLDNSKTLKEHLNEISKSI